MSSTNNEYLQYLFGGLAGMSATCVVQPLDLIKTRMQLSGVGGKAPEHKNAFQAVLTIARTEGVRNMYKGLSAGLLRQATYGTARLGSYNTFSKNMTVDNKPLPFYKKVIAGIGAGAVGSIIGNPSEVALVRMTSDGRLPLDQRRGYKNVVDALVRITREEGVVTLWRGCTPTMMRAMILNPAQLASYSQAKQMLLATSFFKDNFSTHFVSSLLAGFVATAVSIPADLAKTRIQTMKIIDGVPEYKGTLDCLVKSARSEGFLSLWKGFTPYFLRLGPHTILTFVVLEQFNKLYKDYTK